MVQRHCSKAGKDIAEAQGEREPAMYGDEESGTLPDELYSREDAEEALSWAVEVFQAVSRLFRKLTGADPW